MSKHEVTVTVEVTEKPRSELLAIIVTQKRMLDQARERIAELEWEAR
jgi:hypothetical protein